MTTALAQETWGDAPGAPVAADLRAWGPLGGGRRRATRPGRSRTRWCPVVVKLPRPGLVRDPLARADLAGEAAVAAGLTHPGIQRLYEAVLDADVPYLVTEYVEGPTLGDSIAADGPLPPDEVALLG